MICNVNELSLINKAVKLIINTYLKENFFVFLDIKRLFLNHFIPDIPNKEKATTHKCQCTQTQRKCVQLESADCEAWKSDIVVYGTSHNTYLS